MCDYIQNLFSVLKENASDINFLTMFTCSVSRDLRISLAVRRVPVVSRIAWVELQRFVNLCCSTRDINFRRKKRSSKKRVIRARACDKIVMFYALVTPRRWYVRLSFIRCISKSLRRIQSARTEVRRKNGRRCRMLHIMRVCHSKLSTFIDIFPKAKHLVK